jgi:hypothetical protein
MPFENLTTNRITPKQNVDEIKSIIINCTSKTSKLTPFAGTNKLSTTAITSN